MTDKKLGIEIGVGVTGAESVDKLQTQVDGLGKAGTAAGQASGAAAQGAQHLGQAAAGAATQAGAAGKAVGELAQASGDAGTGLGKAGAAATAADPALERAGESARRAQGHLAALRDQFIAGFAVKELVQAAAEMEQIRAGLQAVSRDAGVAGQEMEFVRRMASAAGVDVVAAGKAYLGLAAATKGTAVEGETTRQVFEAVTMSMAKAGKSSAETGNALMALSQMAGKGVVQMEELRGQLGEALPGALQATAKGMGITTADLIKLVESGGVLAEDLFPALTKGLRELYGTAPAAQTLSQEITNIRNAFVDMAADLGEAGGLDALKKGAEVAQMAIALLGDTLIQTGQYVGTLAAAVTTMDFSGLSTAFAQIEAESRERLLRAAENNTVLTAALKASSSEAIRTAIAAREAGQAHEEAGQAAGRAGTSVAAMGVYYAKAREEIGKQIDLATKEVEAVKARGDAAIAQASALNDETAKRQAAGKAAAEEAAAVEALAAKKRDELALLQQELSAKQAAVGIGGQVSDQRKKELADLADLVAAKAVDVDKTNAQAAAAREHARATSEGVQAAQAARDAAQALVTVRTAEARSAVTLLEAQRTMARQAEDLARYMGDEAGVRAAKILQMEIEIKLTKAKAEVAKAEADGSISVAKAKMAELQASGQLTPLKKAEIEASIKVAEAKLVEAKAIGGSTALLERQVEALKNLPPQANAAATSTDAVAGAQDRVATSTGKSTSALEGQIDTWGRFIGKVGDATAALKRYDDQGYALNTAGQRVSVAQGNGQTYDPNANAEGIAALEQKYQAALKEYQRLDYNVQNGRAYNDAPILRIGVTQSFVAEQERVVREAAGKAAVAAQQAEAALKQAQATAVAQRAAAALADAGMAVRYNATSGAPQVMSSTGYDTNTGGRSTSYDTAGAQGRTVRIDLTGLGLATTSVTVASDADAARFEGWLRQLSQAAARAGG